MTVEQLQERIQKLNVKIEKIEKRLAKWQSAKTEDACVKHYSYMISWGKTRQEVLDSCFEGYLKTCDSEIRYATRDLEDAKVTLTKYQNLINLENAKDNEFNNNRIQVIWEFLLYYKEQVANYIRENMEVLNEYYRVNSDSCTFFNNRYKFQGTTEEWKAKCQEYRQRERELEDSIHPYTKLVSKYEGRGADGYGIHVVDEAKLEEILLKDCKSRYFKLVDEVTKYTGIITDATNLKIQHGELGGIIIGEQGRAKVQTFSAGGYNIQCFHYRHKVTKLK